MAGPIYVFSTARPTEAWYQLPQEERDSLMAKLAAIREKCGCKSVISCKSVSPEWPYISVTEFPDLESHMKNTELNDELNWHRYAHVGNVMLGTKWEPPS